MIKILVVDDHVMVRRGLQTVLAGQPDMQFVGEAGDGEMAVLLFDQHLPDVTLMDMKMPRLTGVEAIQRIRARHPEARILALTSFDADELVQQALDAGAAGYMLKNATSDELVKAIRSVAAGKRVLAPEAADALIRSLRQEPPVGHDLTERERDVLRLMSEGLSNTEISQRLFLSVSTVKFHVSSLLSKLGVSNRVEAVALAVRTGLVQTRQQLAG